MRTNLIDDHRGGEFDATGHGDRMRGHRRRRLSQLAEKDEMSALTPLHSHVPCIERSKSIVYKSNITLAIIDIVSQQKPNNHKSNHTY